MEYSVPEKKIQLIKYCSFGYDCPIAIISINGESCIFNLEGIYSLIQAHDQKDDKQALSVIYRTMENIDCASLDEISTDDIGGQLKLF